MAAKTPMQRISTFAAACVTLSQLNGPPATERTKEGGLRLSDSCRINSESMQPYVFRNLLTHNPWMLTYFLLGAYERDLTAWRAVAVEPDDVVMCPAILLKKWESGAVVLQEAVSIWRGVLKQTQPEFRKWLILMLRGTLTQELGGPISRFKFYRAPADGESDTRPQRVKDAAALGLRLIGREWSELRQTHKGQPLEFLTPDAKWGLLDLGCKDCQKPYWLGIGKSYSYHEMQEMFS